MRKGLVYFFAYWHPTAQAGGQPDDFSYEGFEGEIFLQDDASQDGFQLWNTRTCKTQGKSRRDEGDSPTHSGATDTEMELKADRCESSPMACGEMR